MGGSDGLVYRPNGFISNGVMGTVLPVEKVWLAREHFCTQFGFL